MPCKIVGLFVEDFGQEQYLSALARKVACAVGCELEFLTFVSRGGRGAVRSELRTFFRVQDHATFPADYIIVGNDGNCQGYVARRNEVFSMIPDQWRDRVALAIPDPHIEAWFFRDLSAFHRAVGACNAPPVGKCDKGFYKNFLRQQTTQALGYSTLGGIEHADEITKHQDLNSLRASGVDLRNFVSELHQLSA